MGRYIVIDRMVSSLVPVCIADTIESAKEFCEQYRHEHSTECDLLILGGSGSGKTRCFKKPLLSRKEKHDV